MAENGTIFKESEIKKVSEQTFAMNVKHAKGMPLSKIKLMVPRLLNNPKLQVELNNTGKFLILDNGTYVYKNKKSLSKIWGSLQYELSHPSSLTKTNDLKNEIKRIEDAINRIDKRKLEGEELLTAITQYGVLQGQVLQIIGEAKGRLEAAPKFEHGVITTEHDIYIHPKIKEMYPDKHMRSTALETVLNIIYSTGLVFMGRFTDQEKGELVYFYIDMALLSREKNWLLHRFIHFAKMAEHNQELNQIVNQIGQFTNERQKNHYAHEFTKMAADLKKLRMEIIDRDYATNQQDEITQKIKGATAKFDSLYHNFDREKRDLLGLNDVYHLAQDCKDILDDLKSSVSHLPGDYVYYMNKAFDYTTDKPDSEFELLLNHIIGKEDTPRGKKELMRRLWLDYRTRYEAAIQAEGFRLDSRPDKAGSGKEYILWADDEYYVCFTESKKIFIYDRYNTMEIDPGALFKHQTYKENMQLFQKAMRCYTAFYKVQAIFNACVTRNLGSY